MMLVDNFEKDVSFKSFVKIENVGTLFYTGTKFSI